MKFVRDILITIGIAGLMYVILISVIFPYEVQQTSSVPNIMPGDRIIAVKASYWFSNPSRGDIIVCHSPVQKGEDLIKRVIGLPGEKVEVKDNQVYINDVPLVEPYISKPASYTMDPVTVPKGTYFILGDNRNVSEDSHLGWFLPRSNVIGKAWLI
jgi:signal peptidase I